jgi:hypothetical protein
VPPKDLILALHNSKLVLEPRIIHLLWKEQETISEELFDLLLSALESSTENYPEILNLLLAECAPYYTIEITENKALYKVQLNKRL